MRDLDPALQARLDSGATTLCRCWRIRRKDGEEFGFTDHDNDLRFEGLTFKASSGLNATAVETTTGLSVDNAQALGALSSAAVTETDIRAGLYDHAEVAHWLVDWRRPDLRVLMFCGHVGEIRRSGGAFEVELRGLAESLNVPVGRSLLRSCDRVLGDAKCRFDLALPGFSGEGLAAEAMGARISVSGLGGVTGGWFAHGTITWLSGANAGETGVVKSDTPAGPLRTLELSQLPTRPVSAGDRLRAIAGCDKRAETCREKFSNFMNFRGFPHIPGDDWVTAYPKDGAIHDGGSQNR